jgi:hypothetical protein
MAEKAAEEASAARDKARTELQAARDKCEKDVKALELKMADAFKKVRECIKALSIQALFSLYSGSIKAPLLRHY